MNKKYISEERLDAYKEAEKIANILSVGGESFDSLSMDEVVDYLSDGLYHDLDYDSLSDEDKELCDDIRYKAELSVGKFLDNLKVQHNVIEDCMSDDEDISTTALTAVARKFSEQANKLDSIVTVVHGYYDNYQQDSLKYEGDEVDEINEDLVGMPKRKPGYKLVKAVRGGKTVWKNKRLPGAPKKRLSAKQKMALVKARRKSHSSAAKQKAKKSSARRRSMGL